MAITNGIIQSVLDYYGSSSSIYRKIVLGTATDSEISFAFTQIPMMQPDVSASGQFLGITYADPVYITQAAGSGIAGSVNSNAAGGAYSNSFNARVPVSFGRDAGTGQAYITGAQQAGATLATIADRAALGVTGVNLGCKLGKLIDQTLYNLSPDWWDEHYPTINPETWPSIVGESETGQKFFRTLFGIEDNGNVTGYVDERVLAQTYQMLRDTGAISTETDYIAPQPEGYTPQSPISYPIQFIEGNQYQTVRTRSDGKYIFYLTITVTPCDYILRIINTGLSSTFNDVVIGISQTIGAQQPYDVIIDGYYVEVATGIQSPYNHSYTYTSTSGSTTGISGTRFWVLDITMSSIGNITTTSCPSNVFNDPNFNIGDSTNKGKLNTDIGTAIIDGDIIPYGGVDGITNITGATQYPPTAITGTTLDDVLTQLKQTYPQLFDGGVSETVLQPDGTTTTVNYVPVPWVTDNPENVTQTAPVTRPDAQQTDYIIDQTTAGEIIADPAKTPAPDSGEGNPPPVYPDTGDGSAPPPVTPTGSASSLWAVYNPTQAEVNAFGGWLWSPDFIDNLLKLFNDPMQAIIGIHKIYATPATGATQPIKCGFLTSNVNSKIVTSQYTTVDCGSVDLQEFFGNVLDYAPHTRVRLYLPFIGFVSLDVGEVMRSTVAVKYTVDVITGACLADVTVTRDGGGGPLYSYGGSCAVHYPVSAGSYTGVISAIAGAALSVVTGNPIGAIHSAMGAHTSVSHSGGFTGSVGAMGIKIPYLVIDRPQSNIATDFPALDGYGSNYSCKVGDLQGIVRCKDVHVECSRAYADELREIEELLKGGVIV